MTISSVCGPSRAAVAVLAMLAGIAPGASAQDVPTTPAGMVAFFLTSEAQCPSGWSLPTSAQGRLLVGVSTAGAVGVTVGSAMTGPAGPVHAHAFRTTVGIGGKDIAAASCNGCNESAGAAGSANVPSSPPGQTGNGAAESTNLPFIQLVVCQKD